jgi:hypothetical protein
MMQKSIEKISASQGVVRRRDVLLAAAMAPTLAVPCGPTMAAASGSAGAILGAIFDSRFAQCLAFAERARSLGIRPFGFTGEMSSLWFDQLLPALQTSAMPLVGLTSTGALFCFEQLAWNAGMRVRMRIDHREKGDAVQHLPSAELSPALRAQLVHAGRDFGRRAADVALSCNAAWGDCTHAIVPGTDVPGSQALVTWVIASSNA